jgi:hypothetical protein
MTGQAEKLLQEAMNLDPAERARLAAELLASLDDTEDDVQEAWAAEIERRSKLAEKEPGTDWRTVLDQVRDDVLRR